MGDPMREYLPLLFVGAVIGTLCAWAAWKLYQLWENKRNRVL